MSVPAGAAPADRLRAWLEVPLSSRPQALAEGDSVLYLSTAGGLPELWEVPAAGGHEHRVLASRERIAEVVASPHGRRAVVAVDRAGDEHWQLQLIDRSAGSVGAVALTADPTVIHLPGRWTDSGDRFLYAANARDARFFDIYELAPDAPAATPRLRHQGDAAHHVVDAGGGRVLVARSNTNLDQDLLLLSEERTLELTPHDGELTVLAAALLADGVYAAANPGRELSALVRYRPGASAHEFVQTFPGDLELVEPSPSRELLALSVNRDGWSEVHLFDPRTREDRVLPSGPRGVVGRIAWYPDGSAFAYDVSSVEGVEVYRKVVETGKERRLTGRAEGRPAPIPPPRLGRARASDGVSLPFWEYRPVGTRPRGTVFYLHGGPESQARPAFSPFLSFLVGEGFRVVAPNVRGSTGYGRTFTHLDDRRLRMDSVRDVADLAREEVRLGRAERGRLGLVGGSYGGFLVLAAAATYPELWGAAVDLVGIANWVTFLERTGPWRRRLREAEYGSLDKDREFLESISPVRHAAEITAPLLVIHGRNDPRVPVGEAEQIVATLRALDRPVELLIFENEGHGIVRRENQLTAWSRAAAFLERHLAPR